jgi:hypothetical protein
MVPRNLHIVRLLIRQNLPDGQVGFLVVLHGHWKNEEVRPILALPAKKTVTDSLEPFMQGTSILTRCRAWDSHGASSPIRTFYRIPAKFMRSLSRDPRGPLSIAYPAATILFFGSVFIFS